MINLAAVFSYCKDDITKIDNYAEAVSDKTSTWHCHHRLELTLDGGHAHTKQELIKMGMYYGRPYFELIFLRPNDHSKLHHSEGTRSYRSEVSRRCCRSGCIVGWERLETDVDSEIDAVERWVELNKDTLGPPVGFIGM